MSVGSKVIKIELSIREGGKKERVTGPRKTVEKTTQRFHVGEMCPNVEGGFSHVAVRSCASRTGGSLVGEPRLLRPSITLTPGVRGGNGERHAAARRRTLPADRRWKSES